MEQKSSTKSKQAFDAFIRYSALGTEMVSAILLCAWLGSWLDEKTQTTQPYWTLALMLFGVFSSIVLLIKNLKRAERKNNQPNR
ncbi:MAG: AtpZ/AtpI family protein [Flammeovirgaceae bacterium]|nr:AtpZ/AtpI family protein [Flammeovirgaceae bacterium]MDW8288382.1 AtpZ/AtpI family protein [Flammeovirgaceae bacterium]